MGHSVIVEARVIGQPGEVVDRDHSALTGETTLRALLVALVHDEVAAHDERRQAGRLLRVLTPADLAAGTTAGRITSGGLATPRAPEPEVAVARALEAFGDGLYLAVLDGAQLTDLDAPLTVTPTSRLRLVRLVALAGG
jgi:hypothetical protein